MTSSQKRVQKSENIEQLESVVNAGVVDPVQDVSNVIELKHSLSDASDYVAADITLFRPTGKTVKFDLFLKLSERSYAHVFSRATGIDFSRIAQYRAKGVKYLYVAKKDEKLYQAFFQSRPESVLSDPKASQSKKAAALLTLGEEVLKEVFTGIETTAQISREAMDGSQKLVKHFLKAMTRDPYSLAMMLRVAAHGDYLYHHSLSVSVMSVFIAKATGETNPQFYEICGLGGLLHDVGYAMISQELLDSPAALTPSQWREVRSHTIYGMQMVEGSPCVPDEVGFIIAQHHEDHRGTGYPAGLKGAVTFMPAQIVGLADTFCALTSRRPYRDAYTVEEALGIIQHEAARWDPTLVQCLTRIFNTKVPVQKAAA